MRLQEHVIFELRSSTEGALGLGQGCRGSGVHFWPRVSRGALDTRARWALPFTGWALVVTVPVPQVSSSRKWGRQGSDKVSRPPGPLQL